MYSSGKGEENTRYAEVHRSEENSRYSERLSAKESAGYKEYSAVGSETNATAKGPSFPKRASRKKKTTTKLVAALLVSAGAAVVTVTAVMAMVSVALLGIAVDADSLTATVEGLESFREYWACFRVGSTQSACVYAIPAPAVAQRDILLTDLADGGSGTEFVGTARGLAVNLPDATWKNAGGWGSDVPLYSGEGWINLWHQNEIAALSLTPNELFRMPRRMTLSVDFSLSDASQNGFGAGFWPETLPTSSQAQGNFTGLWLIRDNTRNTCTLTLWRSGFPVRSVELDALAEAFSGTARGTLSFQADLTAGILFDAELNSVPVGGFGTPAALPFADDAAHVGVITYSNANVYSLHLTGNAPYPCTIVVLR